MDSPRIDSWWGVRFSPSIQTSSGAHPASCTMGNGSSLMDNAQNNLFLRSHDTIQNLYTWIKKTQLTTCNPNYLGCPSSSGTAYQTVWTHNLCSMQCSTMWHQSTTNNLNYLGHPAAVHIAITSTETWMSYSWHITHLPRIQDNPLHNFNFQENSYIEYV